MNDRIVHTMMNHLSNRWVTDTYAWQDDFLEEYFCNWVYSPNDCFEMVTKDEFYQIIHYNYDKGYTYKRMVDNLNQYIWLYAQESFQHPDVQAKIKDILRIEKVKRMLPMVLNRHLPTDIIPSIWSFIPWM